MGSYLSRTTDGQAANPASGSPNNANTDAQQQKVSFADPLASDAQPLACAQPAEQVLQRRNRRPRMSSRVAARMSAPPTPKARITDPPAVVVAGVFPAAAAPAAAATPKATPKPRGRPPASGRKSTAKKTAAAAAAPVPDLVIVGKAAPIIAQPLKKQKGTVPAQKVNMKRVAKRALNPVGQKGGRGKKI